MNIRFLHLNIEGRKHIDKVCDFLAKEDFDVVCMQEIFLDTAILLSERFGFEYVFSDLKLRSEGESRGNAIFSKTKFESMEDIFLLDVPEDNMWGYREERLLVTSIKKGEELFNIATFHLPVNYPGDVVAPFQIEVYEKLKVALRTYPDLCLTGDFNSPRGTFIFDSLAKDFTDNIPQEEITTLDPVLHRAGFLPYVVDGVFTTNAYEVSDVVVHQGLSDHKGISGTLFKKK